MKEIIEILVLLIPVAVLAVLTARRRIKKQDGFGGGQRSRSIFSFYSDPVARRQRAEKAELYNEADRKINRDFEP